MIDLKIPRNIEYSGKEERIGYKLYEDKQKLLGITMDKKTGEHYVIIDKMGTMRSYKKYC